MLQIDPGVLHAFLEVSRAHKTHFERSSLPSEAQLNLHVDGREFLSLVQTIISSEEVVETLAEVVHRLYCSNLHSAKKHSAGRICCKTYQELDAEEKEQNRAFVRDIPLKLAQVGYRMVPATGRPQTPELTEVIEKLAEVGHLRWLKAKIELGWRHGPKTDKARKIHQALLWWRKLSAKERDRLPSDWLAALGKEVLPEVEKQKDREMVRQIPEIITRAGYSLVKTPIP